MLLLSHCMYMPQACTEIVPMQTSGHSQWFQSSKANRKAVHIISCLSFACMYVSIYETAAVAAYVCEI